MKKSYLSGDILIIAVFSLLSLLVHLIVNAVTHYGIFRDEFYYLACANHLSFGYVDHPPFSIFILAVNKFLFGDSLFSLRIIPAFLSSLTIFIAGLITIEMNGRKFALVLTSSAILLTPIFLGINTFYSMNSFDIFLWMVSAYLLIRLIKFKDNYLWIILGIVLGIALLNKVSAVWLCAGISVSFLFPPFRKYTVTRWPYITAAIAMIIFLPFIIWNLQNNFAHLEFIRNATAYKYSSITRSDFIFGVLLIHNPLAFPIYTAGFFYPFFSKEGKKFMPLSIIFAVTFIILLINGHSKAEYLSSALMLLFPAGGIFFENIITQKYWNRVKFVLPSIIFLSGIMLMPFSLPILPPPVYAEYSRTLHIQPSSSEAKDTEILPQFFADMFGWENMAATLSKVYQTIPDTEKNSTVIFAGNYGEAGALEYYSRKFPLPKVISPHNSYWLWGYGNNKVTTVIVIGGNKADHLKACRLVKKIAVIKSKYAMPYENNLPVYICRDIYIPITQIWNSSKHFE